jgi:hypothetical protein
VVFTSCTLISMVSWPDAQGPLTCHTKVYMPGIRFDIWLFAELGFAKVAVLGPLTTVHRPTCGANPGLEPFSFTDFPEQLKLISAPALIAAGPF